MSTLLVALKISVWGNSTKDKSASDSLTTANAASKGSARVWKSLFPECAEYSAVKAAERKARKFHEDQTLPWKHDGIRLLPAKNVQTYTRGIRQLADEFDMAARAFIKVMQDAKTRAKEKLGSLYCEADYPTPESISSAFGFRPSFEPLPSATNFDDLGIDDLTVAGLKVQLRKDVESQLQSANKVVWTRLIEKVEALGTRLADSEHQIKEGLLDSVYELMDTLPRLNFTEDPELERMIQQVRDTLSGKSITGLREDKAERANTAAKLGSLQSVMSSYLKGGKINANLNRTAA